jgi:hypothetical protein
MGRLCDVLSTLQCGAGASAAQLGHPHLHFHTRNWNPKTLHLNCPTASAHTRGHFTHQGTVRSVQLLMSTVGGRYAAASKSKRGTADMPARLCSIRPASEER